MTDLVKADTTVLERVMTRVAIPEEPKAAACGFVGCDNEATRSDGMCNTHSRLRTTLAEAGRRAGEILVRNNEFYAELHKAAAINAALKGDDRPIQWALERTGVVKPAPKEQVSNNNNGVIVNIGAILPGLGL